MDNISQRDKLKKIVYDIANQDLPVKLEWVIKCGIDLDNEDTFTDENLKCLKKYNKTSEKE